MKFYLYINGEKIEVSEEVYRSYWRETEHEKHMRKQDKKHKVHFFSGGYDENYISNIVDKNIDVEKIIETTLTIEALKKALESLNDDEKEIIYRLFFNEEKLSELASNRGVSYQAIQKKRNKILAKLRKFLEEIY